MCYFVNLILFHLFRLTKRSLLTKISPVSPTKETETGKCAVKTNTWHLKSAALNKVWEWVKNTATKTGLRIGVGACGLNDVHKLVQKGFKMLPSYIFTQCLHEIHCRNGMLRPKTFNVRLSFTYAFRFVAPILVTTTNCHPNHFCHSSPPLSSQWR